MEHVFGSQSNGNCTNASQSFDGNPVCAGTSVLNDGIIPALDGVSSNESWATDLFTLSRKNGRIILSFEVDSESHDHMELAVFNCPQMRISLSSFSIYFDESFRPDRMVDSFLGTFIAETQLVNTSCDQLLVFCVKYTTESLTRFINVKIPRDSTDYVFLGEITFLNGGNKSCDLGMPITAKTYYLL